MVTAQLLPSLHREIDWRRIAPMGLAAALFMPAGSWMLVSLDASVIGTGVGVIVIVFSLVLLAGWKYRGPRPLLVTLAVGGLSGFLMALTSLGNPPVMIYLLSGDDPAAVSRANFTGYFAITLVALIGLMTLSGLMQWQALTTALVLLPGFMIAAWMGSRLFRRANDVLYRRVALGILFCAGVYALIG